MKRTDISRAAMGRVPTYLHYLQSGAYEGEYISSAALARALGLGEVQVRKDLAALSGEGKPKIGYRREDLIATLGDLLACNTDSNVVIVGAGKLGRALLDYGGFQNYGLSLLAAFDIAVHEKTVSPSGKPIFPMAELRDFCAKNRVRIGVIAVPAAAAQEVCDNLLAAGVGAIWCFAPCTLTLPPHVPVQYENMALSLAYLRKNLTANTKGIHP